MSIKFGSNRFIPRPASGGDSLWQLYGANVVGLVDLANKVAIGTNAMLSDEELRVAGGIAATPSGAGNDAFVQVGSGSALALSGANSFRLIYNAGTGQAEISTNGGAFVPLGGGVGSAFVQNGNSFGVPAVLGTNDAHNLLFEVNGITLARLTTTNQFLIGQSHTIPIFNEVLSVAGGILSRPTVGGAGNDSYLQIGDGAGVAVSTANAGRFRYNAGVAQVSLNAGAYSDLMTSATLPLTAFVQNGNSFGSNAVLGTNDAFALEFETSGTTRGRFTSTGSLLVNNTATSHAELFRVTQSASGSAAAKATVFVDGSVTTTDSSSYNGIWVDATSAINSPDTANLVQGGIIRAFATGTASVALYGSQIVAAAGPGATGVTITQAIGVNGQVGFDAAAVSGAITNAYSFLASTNGVGAGKTIGTASGLVVNNLGAAQVTNAIGVDIGTQSGAVSANIGLRTQSPVVVATTGVSASESLRVAGGGALVDGTQFVASVSGAASINSAGASINIGNNADAFAINIGTGAAARTVTIGNVTGTTSLVLNAGTGNIDIGTGAQARTVRLATGGAAQAVTLGSTFATSSMTIDTGGALSIATSATNRTINFATAAANQTINFGSVSGTSSFNFFYGSAGWNTTQANATTGTPVGFVYTAGTHTGLSVAEATDANWNLGRTVTFGAGGTLATQRAYRVQGPTYASTAALTMTEVATLSVGIPIAGGNVSFTAGANAPTLPIDSGAAGGAYAIVNSPGIRVEGTTANATVGVSLLLKNTGSNASAMPAIGWQSNGNTLDATMGVQAGNAFNHQRFALLLRASSTLTPVLTISTQGGYRFTNPAPNDPATTPAGFLFTGTANGAVNTYATTVEANQVNFALNQTHTFATGAIASQRSFLIQAPTYAFSAASTVTDAATVAITSAPIAGAAATFTRSMAIWAQAGIARFDGGVGVKVTPGGTTVQGLAADFRKTYDPGLVAYVAGISVAQAYSPATGYLSILPAWWTIPAAINSGGGIGPPLNPGIRFTWSDGTTTDRFNTSIIAAITETRDSIDFNKDGLAIVEVSFIVNNTSGGAASVDFTSWTTDGNQF